MENKKINILALSLFGKKGASSRYRLYQYIPLLEKKGIIFDAYPLISDNAYDVLLGINKVNKYSKSLHKFYYVIVAMAKRFFQILKAGRYDLVFIQKDVLPSFYLYILRKLNDNIIFDLDDALYENHATIKPSLFSLDNIFFKFRKNNLNNILKCAKAVTVTTPYLAEYVKKFNPNVHVITGPINCELYNPVEKQNSAKITIGWIGSPVTTKYIQDITAVFIDLQEKYNDLQFIFIGAKKFNTQNINIRFLDWSEETEIDMMSEFDIGIMPLSDDEWSKGKGGLKILQYFAMKIPAVCSPVGINTDLVKDGDNGYLAKDNKEWVEKLGFLIENGSVRKEMGIAGRKLVEQKFDLKNSVDYIEKIINEVIK